MVWIHLAAAATLTVGPSGEFSTPCEAIAAAEAGEVIEVDAAGAYAGDTCAWSTDGLTVRGVNGRPLLDGTGAQLAQQKGIFVIQAATAWVENLEFVGASVADANGAGIRHQGTELHVTGCVFRDNENGILGSPSVAGTGAVYIRDSEFEHNGAGDGYSHNLYLGNYATVSFEGSYSHRGNVGHLFKSRAASTWISASRFTDEEGGAASYEIDLPDAGSAWIVGSIVEQVGTTQNSAMIAYGEESLGAGATDLHIINSTLVNHHDRGTFLSVGAAVQTPAHVVNTLFTGAGTLSSQASTTFVTSWDDSLGDPLLIDPAGLDVQLQAGSPCIDAGSDPGETVAATEFTPPAGERARTLVNDAWDIGAYEFGSPAPDDDSGGDTAPEGDNSSLPGTANCGCNSGASPAAAALAAAVLLVLRRR